MRLWFAAAALDAENIYWLEEPIRHDDYAGEARLARELKTPIQIGENFSLPANMQVAIDAGAADYVMPDLERIGGVTGWMQAAAIASTRKLKMSSHLFPEVSAHLLAATPTCHYLEYVDWANELGRGAAENRERLRDYSAASRQRHGVEARSGRTISRFVKSK